MEKVLKVAVILAVVCALALTTITIRRELFSPRTGKRTAVATPFRIQNAAEYESRGLRIGPADSRTIVVEFSDFECPYCAQFTNGILKSMRSKYPNQFAVLFRHWPAPFHRFAYPAARAAECAADQGVFEQFHDALFARQDSLGLLPFTEFAKRARVPDIQKFEQCATRTDSLISIQQDAVAATRLKIGGTPTVVVNGLVINGIPDSVLFETELRAAMRTSNVRLR